MLSLSPSLNSFSSSTRNFAEIADRVVQELVAEYGTDEFLNDDEEKTTENSFGREPRVEDDDEFEFAVLPGESDLSTISADMIFFRGEIRPVYPVFDRDLLLDAFEFENRKAIENHKPVANSPKVEKPSAPVRLPLRTLMTQERKTSLSEADDLNGVPEGTYCVWKPKPTANAGKESTTRCKKSCSAGSSRRWKFVELARRSSSDGNGTFRTK